MNWKNRCKWIHLKLFAVEVNHIFIFLQRFYKNSISQNNNVAQVVHAINSRKEKQKNDYMVVVDVAKKILL